MTKVGRRTRVDQRWGWRVGGRQRSRKQKVSFKAPEHMGRILEPPQTGSVSHDGKQDGALSKFLDYSRARSQALESYIVPSSSFSPTLLLDFQPDKALWLFSEPASHSIFLVKCLCCPPRRLLTFPFQAQACFPCISPQLELS